MGLAENLKKQRIRNSKTLQEVGDAIGISKTYVWKLEREGMNANPTYEVLQKLAKYYDTDISLLIGEKTDTDIFVFGRKFENVDEETKEMILNLAKKLTGEADDR